MSDRPQREPNIQGLAYDPYEQRRDDHQRSYQYRTEPETFTAAQLERNEIAGTRIFVGVRVTITRKETEVVEGS